MKLDAAKRKQLRDAAHSPELRIHVVKLAAHTADLLVDQRSHLDRLKGYLADTEAAVADLAEQEAFLCELLSEVAA